MSKQLKFLFYFIFLNKVATRAESIDHIHQIKVQRLKNAREMFFSGSKLHHQQIMVEALAECVLEHNKMNVYFISTLFTSKNPDYDSMARRMPLYPKAIVMEQNKPKRLKVVK